MNPCLCGWLGDPHNQCTCSPSAVGKYRKRISGPLMDRIDIVVEVPRIEYEKLTSDSPQEDSHTVRQRVEEARERQLSRFSGTASLCNADMGPQDVWSHCQMDDTAQGLARTAMDQLKLSARAFHRVLKVARTIADLAGADRISVTHLAESVQYRQRGLA